MKEYKIVSWNVNGLRAILKKGFLDYLKNIDADIIGIQETKLQEDQVPDEIKNPHGYESLWNFADKKGYSGTAVFYKVNPLSFRLEFDEDVLNNEGRIIELEYPEFTLFNIYFPNGQMSEERLNYKLEFYDKIFEYFLKLRSQGRKIVVMGDVNTAHKPIDLKNPEANKDRSGFLPIERKWIDKLLDSGFIDTFRMFNKEGENYTWWTYRFKAREKNIGWRIDYFFVTEDLKSNVKESLIHNDIYGSDHCPISLKLKF